MGVPRISAVICAAVVATAVAGSTAYADTDFERILVVDDSVESGGSDGLHTVTATCGAVAGTTSGFDEVTYQVRASADAAGPSVALSTGVLCVVYNKLNTTEVFGRVTGGLVGSHAEAVKQVIVRYDHPVKVGVCATGSGQWLDGTNVPYGNCP